MKLLDKQCSIIFENKEYDYNTICHGCSKWLSMLEEKKIEKEGVLIFLDMNEKVLYLLIALLSTNNTYIPVDVKMPQERVHSISDQAMPTIIVTSRKYSNMFKNKSVIYIEDYMYFPEYKTFTNHWGGHDAYCIFTSGSTGSPKGVIVSKNALKNFIYGTEHMLDLSDCSSILCVTSMSFDIFGLESIYALNQGKRVFLANETQKNSPRVLLRLIHENQVDCIQMTPSRLRVFNYSNPELNTLEHVKAIIVGGEEFPSSLLAQVQEKLNARIYNAYGPSEATIWVSYSELTDTEVNIGIPMEGTRFYLLNEEGQRVEDNSIGELYIGGGNLAKGYLGNVQETQKRFLNLAVCGERVYKTGDLCRIRKGAYYWIGRIDNQVKYRGYRIELEEIEKVLSQYQGVTEVIVYLYKNKDLKKQYLVAVVVSNLQYEEKNCIQYLKEYLSDYMIPQVVKTVADFPYMINGKVNRKLLIQTIQEDIERYSVIL